MASNHAQQLMTLKETMDRHEATLAQVVLTGQQMQTQLAVLRNALHVIAQAEGIALEEDARAQPPPAPPPAPARPAAPPGPRVPRPSSRSASTAEGKTEDKDGQKP